MTPFAALLLLASLHHSPHVATVTRWAEFYGVPVTLALRVADVESSMVPTAQSRRWVMVRHHWKREVIARGLMQIHVRWQAELSAMAGVKGFHWWSADDSAHVGIAYLARLHRRYGDWYLAVAAYNCGPGRLESARALPRETVEYLRRIFG